MVSRLFSDLPPNKWRVTLRLAVAGAGPCWHVWGADGVPGSSGTRSLRELPGEQQCVFWALGFFALALGPWCWVSLVPALTLSQRGFVLMAWGFLLSFREVEQGLSFSLSSICGMWLCKDSAQQAGRSPQSRVCLLSLVLRPIRIHSRYDTTVCTHLPHGGEARWREGLGFNLLQVRGTSEIPFPSFQHDMCMAMMGPPGGPLPPNLLRSRGGPAPMSPFPRN